MPIVICGGNSVTDYDIKKLQELCSIAFTFAVNDSCFLFPCDVVVSLDPKWVQANAEQLKKLNKPIITREGDFLKELGLTLTELPNAIIKTYPLSGSAAVKIADKMSEMLGKKSFVFGMDGTQGHYTGRKSNSDIRDNTFYEALGLKNTVNMSKHSKISAWPKLTNLPKPYRVVCANSMNIIGAGWVRGYARKILMGEQI